MTPLASTVTLPVADGPFVAADGVVVHDAVGPVVAALRVARVVRATVDANLRAFELGRQACLEGECMR